MYKLLNQEKNYLSELKNMVAPTRFVEEQRLDLYLDYLDFMKEAEELFSNELLYENVVVVQEVDVAKLKSDVMRFMGLKRTLMDRIKGAVGQGNTSAAEKLKNQLGNLEDKISAAKKAISSAAGDVSKGVSKMGGNVAKSAGELAGKAKDVMGQPGAQYAAAAAVAVGGAALAYKAYKRFFSQAARACKGKSGAEKTGCMKQFKVKGLMASKAALQSSMGKCGKDKNPAKCKASLQKKVQSTDAKISKLKG